MIYYLTIFLNFFSGAPLVRRNSAAELPTLIGTVSYNSENGKNTLKISL